MAEGPQAITTKRLGMKIEALGARATAPYIYIIAGGKITPTSSKGSDKRRVSGNRDPVLSTRKPETFKISIPLPALIEDNGLGELLLMTFGTAAVGSQLGSSTAYDHTFTANDTIKTFTLWLYDDLHPQSVRFCTVDQVKYVIDAEKGSIEWTFDVTGADMVESETWGSASYVNVATDKPKMIPATQTILEYGEPQSPVSKYWKKITVTSKENPKYGAHGKAPVPAGASTPKLAVKGDRDFTIDIDLIDTDGDELRRWRVGGDTNPTATAQADVQALTKFRVRSFGNQTKASTAYPWYYAHQANVGAVTLTMGGTYTAGLSNTPAFYEIYCTTEGTPDKFKWRKNGGDWSAEVEVVGTAMATLGDGLEVTFSATDAMTAGDTYFIFSHYQRMIEWTSLTNVIDDFNYKDSTDFYEATIKLYHESGIGGTKPSCVLRNTRTGAYTGSS